MITRIDLELEPFVTRLPWILLVKPFVTRVPGNKPVASDDMVATAQDLQCQNT
jgi:hypothetical protein